ncbi:MAG: hypothetical protein ABIO43_01255 [Sphingomicrobium sp.]
MTKMHIIRRGSVPLALTLSLAACGGGGGNGSDKPGDPPTVITTAQEDRFGVAFGTAFRAPLNGEPVPVNDGDLVPVSLTTEPIDITP